MTDFDSHLFLTVRLRLQALLCCIVGLAGRRGWHRIGLPWIEDLLWKLGMLSIQVLSSAGYDGVWGARLRALSCMCDSWGLPPSLAHGLPWKLKARLSGGRGLGLLTPQEGTPLKSWLGTSGNCLTPGMIYGIVHALRIGVHGQCLQSRPKNNFQIRCHS